MIRICVLGMFLTAFLMSCSTQYTSGVEVENEKFTAVITLPDGKPAGSATFTLLPVDYIANGALGRTAVKNASGMTDASGRITLSNIEKGYYNLYAKTDSLVAFKDSLYLGDNGLDVGQVKVGEPARVSGTIQVQPNHDPRNAVVHVLGTTIYANVDSNGVFVLKDLAPGKYNLCITIGIDGYVATYKNVEVFEAGNHILEEISAVVYTGIPVVTGLHATYDTAQQCVKLTWKPVSFSNLSDYIIYKDNANAVELSTNPIASTIDTFYIDTAGTKVSSTISFRYRVAARDHAFVKGETYRSVTVTLEPGFSVDTTPPVITFSGPDTISILVGDPDNILQASAAQISAMDDTDGDVTSSMVVLGTVNINVVGNYELVYQVSDKSGNTTMRKRTFIIYQQPSVDTVPPVITLMGSSTIIITVGESYTEPGYAAVDDIDGNITDRVVTSGSVDTATVGSYSMTYTVIDSAGNAASVLRTVTVVE